MKYEDRPIPTLQSPHDVLVHIKQTGICGSDVHFFIDGYIGENYVKEPMVLGHESSGVIAEVGSAVTTLKKGDSVSLEPGVPCRRCIRCKEGKYNLCSTVVFAASPPTHGTLSKYYALPEDFCYLLPKEMSLEEGALVEPTSVAVHIVKQADVKPGQSVVVFGAGPVGLLCCAIAKVFGATQIIAVDIQQSRLDFAARYAATGTYMSSKTSAQENATRLVREHNLDAGADVAIDASGAEVSVQTAIHVLRPGGTYVQGGMGGNEITFPIMAMCVKELNVRGSFRYGCGDYDLAINLITSGRVSVKELITGRVAFREAEQAFTDVKAGKGIKTMIAGVED